MAGIAGEDFAHQPVAPQGQAFDAPACIQQARHLPAPGRAKVVIARIERGCPQRGLAFSQQGGKAEPGIEHDQRGSGQDAGSVAARETLPKLGLPANVGDEAPVRNRMALYAARFGED